MSCFIEINASNSHGMRNDRCILNLNAITYIEFQPILWDGNKEEYTIHLAGKDERITVSYEELKKILSAINITKGGLTYER